MASALTRIKWIWKNLKPNSEPVNEVTDNTKNTTILKNSQWKISDNKLKLINIEKLVIPDNILYWDIIRQGNIDEQLYCYYKIITGYSKVNKI